MSEERHLPSNSDPPGAAKAAAKRTASDSAIDVVIDDETTAISPPPPTVVTSDAPPPPSTRVGEVTKRTRQKMTLKIPDDEVARPQTSPPPPKAEPVAAAPPPPEPPMVPMTPMRIITIEPPASAKAPSPPAPVAPRAIVPAPAPVPAPGISSSAMSTREDSWTPYQPSVADRAGAQTQPLTPPAPPVGSATVKQIRPAQTAAVERSPAAARGSHPSGLPMPAAPIAPSPPAGPAAPPVTSGTHAVVAPIPAPAPVAAAAAAPAPPPPAPLPPPPVTAPIPSEPPTQPRSESIDDILVVTESSEEPPTSLSDLDVSEDSRPTNPPPEPKPAGNGAIAAPAVLIPAAAPPAPAPGPTPAPPATPASPAAATSANILTPPPQPALSSPPSSGPIAPTALRVPSQAPAPAPAAAPPPAVVIPPATAAPAIATAKEKEPGAKDNLPPMRALAPTEPEALEVQFEDELPVSSARVSEPEAEIGAEDLVSIESVPVPSKGGLPQPQLRTETPARAFIALGNPGAAPPSAAASAARSVPPPPSVAKPPASQKLPPTRVIVPTASALAPPPMSESAPGRRKARPWWEELFNDDFIRTMARVTDSQISAEVDYIEESLAVAKGAMLLDIACGTGRHAIELTRRGYKVVGFDLSLPMLAKAAEEAQDRGQKLNFVQGDMREMTFEDTFDGIYCWNTSFGFFEEDKNAQVIQRVHKALKKGGQFVLEVGNRDYMIRQAPSLAWFEGDGCICMDEMSIDWITSRMRVKRTMMMDDGRTKEIDYSVRIYSLHELGKILHEAGFRVAEVSGRTATPGVFFGNESPRTMILAEKK